MTLGGILLRLQQSVTTEEIRTLVLHDTTQKLIGADIKLVEAF